MNNARGWYPAVGRLNGRLLVAGGKVRIVNTVFYHMIMTVELFHFWLTLNCSNIFILQTGIPPDDFSFEVWDQREKQWQIQGEGTSKQSKFKSANVLLYSLPNRYDTIFQNCFIRR